MFNVELKMKNVTTCEVKTKDLEQFVQAVQDGGMLVFITDLDREPVDMKEALYDDEYLVSIFKTENILIS